MYIKSDFHIHTKWSDGQMSIHEIIALYRYHGINAIAITDHVIDSKTYAMCPVTTITKESWPFYIEQLQALSSENLLVIPGAEITNSTAKWHILAIGITEYIDADQSIEDVVQSIHIQDGIAIAAHPHPKYQDLVQPVHEFFHENLGKYSKVFDAWEVGNRYELFSRISFLGLPYVANSDLHEPDHFYSWKNLLEVESLNLANIKDAIKSRRNYIWRAMP